MSSMSDRLRLVVADLHLHDSAKGRDIQQAIESSPLLVQQMSAAADKGSLKHIRFSSASDHAGGYYDAATGTIYISQDVFTSELEAKPLHDLIVGTLGHETSHALDADRAAAAVSRLDYEIHEAIQEARATDSNRVDLTPPVERYITAGRDAEARAELAGLNALASRVAQEKGGIPDTNELLGRAAATTECGIRTGSNRYQPAAGLSIDPSGHFQGAREAIARCHFDASHASLGRAGNATYRNYYAGYPIERIAAAIGNRDKPEIWLGLTQLRLDPAQIQDAGLDFKGEGRRVGVTDPAIGKVYFQHNHARGGQRTPDAWTADHRDLADGAAARAQDSTASMPFSAPAHPDHALYRSVGDSLQARLPAGAMLSEDRLAQLTLAARQAGIGAGQRMDMAFGDTWVALQGAGPAQHARVDLTMPPPPALQSAAQAAELDQAGQQRQRTDPAAHQRPEQQQAAALSY